MCDAKRRISDLPAVVMAGCRAAAAAAKARLCSTLEALRVGLFLAASVVIEGGAACGACLFRFFVQQLVLVLSTPSYITAHRVDPRRVVREVLAHSPLIICMHVPAYSSQHAHTGTLGWWLWYDTPTGRGPL